MVVFLTFLTLFSSTDRCDMPLGVEEGEVADQLMSASSHSVHSCSPQFGRLNGYRSAGAWCAKRNDGNQWLQVDFGAMTRVTRVATQGRRGSAQWVKTYSVSYSKKGYGFAFYRERGRTKVRILDDVMLGKCDLL
jgi:hypothetical protein